MASRNPTCGEPLSRVELSLSAEKLRDKDVFSKSDPVCVVFLKSSSEGKYFEIGRTEMVNNCLSPQWVKKIELDYRFEERQFLKFGIYDWDNKKTSVENQDNLGSVECTLGEIMARQGTQLFKALPGFKNGTFKIMGEEVSSKKEIVTFHWRASDLDKKDMFGKSDPFLIFYRSAPNGGFNPIHKTEIIKNTLDPIWGKMVLPARLFGDDAVKIECRDWDSNDSSELIGECITSLQTLKAGVGATNTYQLINAKKKAKKSSYKNSGQLVLTSYAQHIEPSFLDYLRGGLQLHFTVAIDFTGSNGDPRLPASLHYFQHGVHNQYSLAIRAVGDIIQDYDSDKLFPALGFGAKIPPNHAVSHEFFLNGSSDNPYCQGVEGILAAYQHSLTTVQLYGPTNFAPVINHVSQFARSSQDGKNYFVLLIITDGIISDLMETRKSLVEASVLPISVIIVGVGAEDFSAMEQLDGDDNRLSHGGKMAARDIVQFVAMKQFIEKKTTAQMDLASAVLREVPSQVISYMKTVRK